MDSVSPSRTSNQTTLLRWRRACSKHSRSSASCFREIGPHVPRRRSCRPRFQHLVVRENPATPALSLHASMVAGSGSYCRGFTDPNQLSRILLAKTEFVVMLVTHFPPGEVV